MKRYRSMRAFIICIAMLALSSCKPGADDDNIITVNLSDVNRKRFVNLSEWVSEPEFIALESISQKAYTDGRYCCISDGSGQVYKLYDRNTGKCLRNIGNSNEYSNVYDSMIDEQNSMVYILSWNAMDLLCYDINMDIIFCTKIGILFT